MSWSMSWSARVAENGGFNGYVGYVEGFHRFPLADGSLASKVSCREIHVAQLNLPCLRALQCFRWCFGYARLTLLRKISTQKARFLYFFLKKTLYIYIYIHAHTHIYIYTYIYILWYLSGHLKNPNESRIVKGFFCSTVTLSRSVLQSTRSLFAKGTMTTIPTWEPWRPSSWF